jgi:hypothetical protein
MTRIIPIDMITASVLDFLSFKRYDTAGEDTFEVRRASRDDRPVYKMVNPHVSVVSVSEVVPRVAGIIAALSSQHAQLLVHNQAEDPANDSGLLKRSESVVHCAVICCVLGHVVYQSVMPYMITSHA